MASKGDLLVWANTHDTPTPVQVNIDVAYDLFEKFGLDPVHLPSRIEPIHAFRRAAAETRVPSLAIVIDGPYGPRYLVDNNGLIATLTFIPARRTERGREDFGHRVEWVYERPGYARRKDVREWKAAFEARYTELHGVLSTDQVRTVVRRAILSWNAVLVNKKGGVYVVSRYSRHQVDALGDFLHAVNPDAWVRHLELTGSYENLMLVTQIRSELGERESLLS